MQPGSNPTRSRDWIVALVLAALLGVAWTVRDHAALTALRLPDTDDVMRLQQIRDLLSGQRFADLAQHRLGPPPGLEMHWSRAADLVPGALILLLVPLLGAKMATIVAVTVSPLLLFALMLLLAAAIARRMGQSGTIAVVIAALAHPATTLFFPGRIDHHALQLVLVLGLAHAAIGRGSLRDGAVAGLVTALSLAIGMETAPLLAIGGAAIAIRWALGASGAQARMAGYATMLLLALAAESVGFRSSGWGVAACDGFDATLWRAALCVGLAPAAMALAGFAGASRAARLCTLVVAGAGGLAAAAWLSPACLQPYGQVDPVLARVWLAHVVEAQPLLAVPLGHAIAAAGLALAGLAAGLGWALHRRDHDGWTLLAFQATAIAVTLFQIRGAGAAALLAVPALTAMVGAARSRGALLLLPAWLAAAGIVYAFVADAVTPAAAKRSTPDCTAPAGIARIAALPPGTVLAPADLGAYLLAGSRHRVLAAPYHRNSQGNRAMYDFFLSPPARSEAIARRWGIDYVALCPDSFGELGDQAQDPHRLAGALQAGQVPGWLARVSRPGEVPRVFRLVDRGPAH